MAFIKTKADYAKCGFLIYSCWESKPTNGSTIAGSLLLDGTALEEEARSLVEVYRVRAYKSSILKSNTEYRYIYIKNRPEWWHTC